MSYRDAYKEAFTCSYYVTFYCFNLLLRYSCATYLFIFSRFLNQRDVLLASSTRYNRTSIRDTARHRRSPSPLRSLFPLLYNARPSTLIRADRLAESAVMPALSRWDVRIKYGRCSSPLSNGGDRRGADQKIEGCSLTKGGRPSLPSPPTTSSTSIANAALSFRVIKDSSGLTASPITKVSVTCSGVVLISVHAHTDPKWSGTK